MAHYVIEVSHTEQECLRALQMIVEYGLHVLDHSWFGCKAGVHTGWVDVEAGSPSEARNVLPPMIRPSAQVVEVQRFTAAQVMGVHKS